MRQPEYLPTTRDEMSALGWDELDILLVTGDAYVDSHSFGASLLGRWLVEHGYKTGIVAQPGWENADDVARMGRPRLFAGVTAGALDSLLAHYTAFRKKRNQDAYSPGGAIGLRPNRAAIVYTGLVRQAFSGLPVVLGGIEGSLRRASHYDFWSDSLRRSILLDSKADAVLYGMAERSILAFAELFASGPARQRPGEAIATARLPGVAYAVHPDAVPADAEELPSHEAILAQSDLLIKATLTFERQMLQGRPVLVQRSGGRAVVFEPPAAPLSEREMDAVYGLPFTRKAHPSYEEPIPAVAMLEGSVASHRGCGGGCSFCSLAIHQGRTVQSRSAESILKEVDGLTADPEWKGSITDIGGPSSNMWQAKCAGDSENCQRSSCLYPKRCRHFKVEQEGQVELLRRAAGRPGVRHVRVASGVRHDLALESDVYMQALVGEFTGGQLKIAPEHISEKVLRLMRKTPVRIWENFIRSFTRLSGEAEKEQYIIPYLMSAFPGCGDAEMEELAAWLRRRGWRPQQVQCFIPTPGTVATAMFFAEKDVDGRPITVARTDADRLRQHHILMPDEEPASGQERPSHSRGHPREERTSRPERPFRPKGPPRGDRPSRPERPYRSERPAGRGGDSRPERPFRPKGPPRGDRPSRPERPYRSERPAGHSGDSRPERPFRPKGPPRDDRPSRPERPYRSERPVGHSGDSRPERPFRPKGPPRGDRPSRPERPYRSERPAGQGGDSRPERPFRPKGPPRGDRPSRPERPYRSERPAGRDSDSRPERPFRPKGPPRDDRPSRPERPYRSERPAGRDSDSRPERPFRPKGPPRGDRPSRPERPYRSERPAGQSGDSRPERPFRPKGPPRGDRPSRPERPYNSERPRRSAESGNFSSRSPKPGGFSRPGRRDDPGGSRTGRKPGGSSGGGFRGKGKGGGPRGDKPGGKP